MNDCGVYALLNARTGKVYVGSSVGIRKRYMHHLRDLRKGCHHNAYLQRAWQIDANHFVVGVLELCEPHILRDRECYWIQVLHTGDCDLGYNLDRVVDGRLTHSLETRLKIGIASRGRQHSLETRLQMSTARRGRVVSTETRAKLSANNRNRSPETRAKLSTSLQGRTYSPETLAKMSAAARNRSAETRAKLRAARQQQGPASVETRAKISAALTARYCTPETRSKLRAANLGKVYSPETRAKISEAAKIREARRRTERAQTPGARQLVLPLDNA